MSTNTFKLRFGVIGTNTISDKVINAAKQDQRFELVAVYSRTQGNANIFAQKHNIPHTFTSLKNMMESDLIDAVYIASPNAMHSAQSILCMEYGKHVLCEKPLASNAHEVKAMINAAKKHKVVLMEAMIPTLSPNFKAILQNIHKIGNIRRYFASYCQYSSRYDDLKKGIVQNAFMPELSNGAVMDLGIYTIYPMVVLFGQPKKITASGLKLSTGVDGQGSVSFDYDEMNSDVLYSKIANSFLPAEIQGEEGTIIANRINIIDKVELRQRNGNIRTLAYAENLNHHYFEVVEFINLVENGETESKINSHENSLITIEIIDEIRRQIGVVYPADTIAT